MLAAQYMQVDLLLSAVARKFARKIVVENLSTEAIRELFDVDDDFDDDERERVLTENRWLMA
jgi:hypothetical protein